MYVVFTDYLFCFLTEVTSNRISIKDIQPAKILVFNKVECISIDGGRFRHLKIDVKIFWL